MPRIVTSEEVYKALVAAGMFGEDEQVRRVVIDLQYGHVAVVHMERFGDERMLEVLQTLQGIEIRQVARPPELEDGG